MNIMRMIIARELIGESTSSKSAACCVRGWFDSDPILPTIPHASHA